MVVCFIDFTGFDGCLYSYLLPFFLAYFIIIYEYYLLSYVGIFFAYTVWFLCYYFDCSLFILLLFLRMFIFILCWYVCCLWRTFCFTWNIFNILHKMAFDIHYHKYLFLLTFLQDSAFFSYFWKPIFPEINYRHF